MKGVRRARAGSRRQAAALRYAAGAVSVADILALANARLADLRDKAMISLAYDTGLRRTELVAVRVGHVRATEDGHEVFLPRIKGGHDGHVAFLTEETARLIAAWIREAAAHATDGDFADDRPVFRAVDRFGRPGRAALTPDSVNRIFKALVGKAGEAKGLAPDDINAAVASISGHSPRVGSTQDLFAANVEIGPICTARRWADPRMALRYTKALEIQDEPVADVLRKKRK